MALFGSFVVSPEKLFCPISKQMDFYNCHCCKFSHKMGGVILITFSLLSFSQLPPTVRHCSCKAVSILRRMHKTRVLQSQYCQGTKQLHTNSHSPGRQLTQLELLQPPQLRGGREGECKQHMCMVQMLTLMVCHLSRNPSSSEISAETPGWGAKA